MAFSNNSISFNGVDGYVDVEYSAIFNFDRTDVFSVSCWVKTKSTETINTILSKMDSSSGTGYRLSMNASGQFEFILRNTPTTNSLRVCTVADGYNDGGWHHFVVTYDTIKVLIYIDGLVKATSTVYDNLTSSTINTAPFQIGAYDGANVFDGSIDEVAIFSSPISAAKVLEIFGSAKPTDLAIAAYSPLTYSSEYDGTGEHIDFGFNGATRYQPNVPFSMAIWMRSYRPHDNGTEALMSHWNWSPSPGSLGWLLFRYDDGSTSHVGFTMRKNDSTYFLKRTDTAAGINISSGIWRFVVITYDGSGDENGIKLYIDAEEITTGLLTASAGTVDSIDYSTYGTKLRVGQTHSSANAYRGRLLHSAIVSRVLTAGEIANLYSSGLPQDLTYVVDSADIDHWCTLGDGCTTGSGNCPDLSPNAIHGTSQSMETSDFTIDDLPPTPIFVHSPLTTSLLLDGTDEYVEYVEDTGNQLVRTEPFTISIWFKVVTDQEGFLIGRYHNPSGPGANRGWYIRYLVGGSLRWGMVVSSDTGSGLTYQFWTLSAGVNDGEWHQWTVAFNGDNVSPHVNSMLDGVYKPEGSHTITLGGGIRYQPMAHPGEPLRIGYGDDGLGGYKYFDGNIAHAAIHKGVEMDLWDMLLLYADGNPQNLVAQVNSSYLSFWDTLGDGDALGAGNMVDLSIYGNNGEAFNCESGDFETDIPVGRDLSSIGDPDTLFAWWRMGDSDTYPLLADQMSSQYEFPIVRDLSGNSYHGQATNMESVDAVRDTPRSDYCKYSVLFDGSTNYITMGNLFAFEYTDPFSASCWFKTTEATPGWFMAKMSSTGPSRGWGFGIIGSGGEIKFELTNAWSTNVNYIYTDAAFNDGEWHHCVITWDGNASPGAAGMHIYVDGVDQSVTVQYNSLSATMVTTVDLRIGTRTSDHPSQAFAGNLTEAAIYDKELSAGEVGWIYNDGMPDELDGYGAPSNLAAWWRVGTIDQVNKQARDLVWGSSPETSQINDMSRLTNHATATNTEAGDFTSDTPGGESQYSVDLNDHLFSLKSIDFDGSNDYVNMGDAFNFERTDPFSVSFWMKTTTTTDRAIMSNMDSSSIGWTIQTTFGSQGRVGFYLVNNFSTNRLTVQSNSGWNDGDWHHVCVTYDGSSSASGALIYIDGSNDTSFTEADTLTATIVTAEDFNIGRRPGLNDLYWLGGIDEVSIYDKELSSAEVTAIYNSGTPTDLSALSTEPNMIGWWRMGEGDTYPTLLSQVDGPFVFPTIVDKSGYGNDAAMVNMESADVGIDIPRSEFTKYSLNFDGSAEYITMGNVIHFEYTWPFSVTAWFKTTDTGTQMLVSKQEAPTASKGWALYTNSGQIHFDLSNNKTGLVWSGVHTNNTFNDGDWHQVVATYSAYTPGSASDIRIFVDGVEETTVIDSSTLGSNTIINAASFNIAGRTDGSDLFAGNMTDVALYDFNLSSADVEWVYHNGTPRDLREDGYDGYVGVDGYGVAFLVAYWRLGSAYERSRYIRKVHDWVWGYGIFPRESVTITDASAFTNDATLNNMSVYDVKAETVGGISFYSCYFDGISKYAYTPTGTSIYVADNSDVLAYSCWVKTTDNDGVIMATVTSGDPVYSGIKLYLDTGKLRWGKSTNWSVSPGSSLVVECDTAINDGYWHHVVVTNHWIATNNYVTDFYIDGVLSGDTTIYNTLDNNSFSVGGLSIGARGANGYDPFDGYVDEVSIYNKYLRQSDIDEIYNGGAPTDLRDLKSHIHLKGWWRMGDPYNFAGTTVNTDLDDRQGDVPGPTEFTTKSLLFGGTNEYIDMGDPSELDFDVSDTFSFSWWMKHTGISWNGIIGKWGGAPGWYVRAGFDNSIHSSTMQFVMDGDGIIEVYPADRNRAFPQNEWLHIVITYDGSNDGNGVSFYINGEQYPTFVRYNTANTTISNSFPFRAGYGGGSYMTGNMDELSVWDKELTQADVTEIWNGGDPDDLLNHTSSANLVGWWRMGEDGPINGTMTNMAANDINGDVPVSSPEYLITASGSSEIDFGATYNYKWTVGAWIKTDNEFGVIVNKNYTSDFSGWGMRLLGGYPTLWWANSPDTLLTEQRSDVRVDDGYWHHVVAVREKIVYVVPDVVSDYDGNMTNMEVADIQADTPGGISEYSMSFDGVDEYVTMGDVLDFDYNEAVSISVWIKSTDSSGSIIISKRDSAEKGWFLSLATTGAINAGMINTLTTNALNMLTTATGFNDGAWHHVVWAKSTSPLISGSKIYVDGVDRSLTTVWNNLSSSVLNDGSLTMASDNDGQGYIYTGNIDEVAIYNKQLSLAEVTAIYNSGAPNDLTSLPSAANLQAWWLMGDDYLSCRFYVDGAFTGTVTVQDTNAGNTISNSGTVSIGLAKGSGEGEQPFMGKISEVAVWNGTFDLAEVSEVYNSGSPPNLIELSTEPRLRGWWRCGDDNGNPGTYTNFAPTARLGDVPGEEYSTNSFDLDGTDEYVAIDSGISYERTDAFSVSCWFKAQTRNEWPLSQMSTYGWYLDELDNTPYWRMEGATGAIRIYFGYEDIILENEWYHMVVSYDGSSTAAGTKMYINGIEIPAIYVALDTLAGSIAGGTINIGNRESVYFDGQVDDVSIWGAALSDVEIVELYNGGSPGNLMQHSALSDLDGWWRLGDSGSNSDGTMVNMLSSDIVLNAPREPGSSTEEIDYFLMRGIDSACGTLRYHYWIVSDQPDFLGVQAGTLPCGGPLTDVVIASKWTVVS